MNMLRRTLVSVIGVVLVACGSAPRLPNQYSELQLSQLQRIPGGIRLDFRVSNFREKPVDVTGIEFRLELEGRPLIRQVHALDLRVPGFGTEPLRYEVVPFDLGQSAGSLRYRLSGQVNRKGFGGVVPLEHAGTLEPVPGVEDAWR